MKIIVTGINCSGNTYTAKVLSDELSISSFALDDIYLASNTSRIGNLSSNDYRNKIRAEILKSESWIVEGRYLSWTTKLYSKADVVIVLKPNRLQMIIRLFKRFISQSEKEPAAHLLIYIKSIITYPKVWLPNLERVIYESDTKSVSVSSAR